MQIQSWSIQGRSFHFGLHGLGQEESSATMPSDSLFAALVARLARSGTAQEVDAFCQPFLDGSPPFLITSTFPLAGSVRFFPPPLSSRRPPEDVTSNRTDAKAYKRVDFVSEQVYRRLLDGSMLSDEVVGVHKIQAGKVWISHDESRRLPESVQEPGRLWVDEQRPRVTIDRATQASNLFFTGQVTFAEGCGLWFGIRWLDADEPMQQRVRSLLDDLSDAGLGAERNSGLGAARIKDLGKLELPDPLKRWTNLSRYLPRPDEMPILGSAGSAYTLQRVGGWLDSPVRSGQRRKTVNLLAEGSVFDSLPRPVPGQMAEVSPRYLVNGKPENPLGHPVYRSGLALAAGMKEGAA